MSELITRAFDAAFTARADDNGSIVEGRPVIYGARADFSFFGEEIDAGALDGADLTDVRFCLNHDTGYVYARSRLNNGNSTMQITPDASGMTMRANLDTENSPRAKDLYSAISRGDMDKMSFMFTIDGYEWTELESDYPIRHITKIGRVVEVSCVTFPAYESTNIEARDAQALESAKRELESAREALRDKRALDSADISLELAKAKYNYFSRR